MTTSSPASGTGRRAGGEGKRRVDATPDLLEFLSKSPFYGGLDTLAVALVTERLTERRLLAGEVLARDGEPGKSMFNRELCRHLRSAGALISRLMEETTKK